MYMYLSQTLWDEAVLSVIVRYPILRSYVYACFVLNGL